MLSRIEDEYISLVHYYIYMRPIKMYILECGENPSGCIDTIYLELINESNDE